MNITVSMLIDYLAQFPDETVVYLHAGDVARDKNSPEDFIVLEVLNFEQEQT